MVEFKSCIECVAISRATGLYLKYPYNYPRGHYFLAVPLPHEEHLMLRQEIALMYSEIGR